MPNLHPELELLQTTFAHARIFFFNSLYLNIFLFISTVKRENTPVPCMFWSLVFSCRGENLKNEKEAQICFTEFSDRKWQFMWAN